MVHVGGQDQREDGPREPVYKEEATSSSDREGMLLKGESKAPTPDVCGVSEGVLFAFLLPFKLDIILKT